jgi:hypothetical protein
MLLLSYTVKPVIHIFYVTDIYFFEHVMYKLHILIGYIILTKFNIIILIFFIADKKEQNLV